jgi:hypothetical protein
MCLAAFRGFWWTLAVEGCIRSLPNLEHTSGDLEDANGDKQPSTSEKALTPQTKNSAGAEPWKWSAGQ